MSLLIAGAIIALVAVVILIVGYLLYLGAFRRSSVPLNAEWRAKADRLERLGPVLIVAGLAIFALAVVLLTVGAIRVLS